MTSRRLLALVAVVLFAALGLSGCVAIKSESSDARAPGVVTISLSVCASDRQTAGSNCNPNTNTAEGDNGQDAPAPDPQSPYKGQLLVGFRLPQGTDAPDQFTSATQEVYTKNQAYTTALNRDLAPATGFIWVGYLSSSVTLAAGSALTSFSVEFGLPAAADGTPFTGPFLWRAIVGVLGAGGNPSACSSNSICYDSPPPANLGTHKQQDISDFRVMPGTAATAAPGQTATVSFPVRYIDNAHFGARTLNLAGSSTLPGNSKVTPSSATLTNVVNNVARTVSASVTVPAGTAPGNYPVTLTTTDAASGVARSNTAMLTVVDKTPPAITVGSPTDGQVVVQGQQIAASYSCADEPNGSGLASCVGSVPNGGALDTASPGPKAFTVSAADKAGNTAALTRTYIVQAPPPPVIVPVVRRQINISLSFLFAAGGRSTKFKSLVVKGVPKGATVRVRCKGKRCPKKSFKKKARKAGSVRLKPYIKKRLRKGIVLRVSVTKPGSVGMVKVIKIRASKAPKITTACLQPGAKKATRCG